MKNLIKSLVRYFAKGLLFITGIVATLMGIVKLFEMFPNFMSGLVLGILGITIFTVIGVLIEQIRDGE